MPYRLYLETSVPAAGLFAHNEPSALEDLSHEKSGMWLDISERL